MGKLIVVNRYHNKPYDEYGGRGTVLGNYTGLKDRETACDAYEKDFDRQITSEEPNALQTKVLELIEIVKVQDYVIACSCKPHRCHLDTVANYVNGMVKILGEKP